MLEGTALAPEDVITEIAPTYGKATVEKIAINAVMAGCKPEYLPVVIAGVRALGRAEFNLHGLQATTHSATPLFLISGPVVGKIGLNGGLGVFGSGNRANSTVGRALKLVMQNLGGCRSGGLDRSAQGNPGQFSYCIAENTAESPWEPYHVEQGFAPEDSTVTVFAAEAPHALSDHGSRSGEQLVACIGKTLATSWNHKGYPTFTMFIALGPEHAHVFGRDKWTKERIREWLLANVKRPISELLPGPDGGESFVARFLSENPSAEELAQEMPKFMSGEDIHIIVTGGLGGQFSSFIPGWLNGPMGSRVVTEKI